MTNPAELKPIPTPGTTDWWVHLLNHSLLHIPHPAGHRVESTSFRGDLIEFIKQQQVEIAKRDEILKHFGVTEVL